MIGYVGFVIDRATDKVTLMASEEGGTEIEEVAAQTPEKIFKETIDPEYFARIPSTYIIFKRATCRLRN